MLQNVPQRHDVKTAPPEVHLEKIAIEDFQSENFSGEFNGGPGDLNAGCPPEMEFSLEVLQHPASSAADVKNGSGLRSQ